MTAARNVLTRETEWIIMPDGARLAARIWIPEGAEAEPVPAILEYIPYRRRDVTRSRDEAMHPRFAAAGYACIRVDMRGSGDSDGVLHDEYLEQELQDGCDVIAWIAEQPWCDGKVGMMGKSWGAYNAFQVAARRPPALKAIVPVMGTDDRWSECIHYTGGVLMTDNFWWGAIMQLLNALPPDPASVGPDRWKDMWKTRLDGMRFWPQIWLDHQTRDAQWTHGSICENYSDIQVPVYFVGGWADLFRDTPFRIAENLQAPTKFIMGPWAHLYPHEAVPGPKVDFVAEALRWWDHWLKGIENGVMDEPAFRFFVQDSTPPVGFRAERTGRWVEEQTWPSPNVTTTTLWLNESGLGHAAEKTGSTLSICSPQTYGAAAGDMCSFGAEGDIPVDCRIDEGGALSFRSAKLDSPLEILGQVNVRLAVRADRARAFVSAVLADEAPDGAQTLITRGLYNLAHRFGPEKVVDVVPGETMNVTVPLHGIAWRIASGHRLVLHIGSTYWPVGWPMADATTLSIEPGSSAIDLPLRKQGLVEPAPRALPLPPERAESRVTILDPGSYERGCSTDLRTGRVSHRMAIEGGLFWPGTIRLDDTGTTIGGHSERVYSILPDDPLSARATQVQDIYLEREDWKARIRTSAEMTATETEFVLNAKVDCLDGETPFHSVDWSYRIPRNGK